MELGGNAACIVDADADLQDATDRLVFGAFYQSGQSCIGVQRIVIHDSIYDELRDLLVKATNKLVAGDPKEESTFLGPLISEKEAEPAGIMDRVRRECGWKSPLRRKTRRCHAGRNVTGRRSQGSATLQAGSVRPVAVLSKFSSFQDALNEVNDSVFGLQAGIFTRDIYKVHQAWDELKVGGVVIGDVPSWRVDNMPYGGVKDSGLGREGIRFAIEDMTEICNLVIRMPENVNS